jgi:protein-L-isoaspartate(D-aspartate) O-methyltransferase
MDEAAARTFMVNGQLRPNKVTDPGLLAAMGRLPRENFVPAAARARAYADAPVPLGEGRAMMQPMVLGRLVQALRPRLGERALVVGAATGYAAAVLADQGCSVTALEEAPALLAVARVALPAAVPGAQPVLVEGPLAAGHAPGAPYGVMLLDGAVEALPPALLAQLAEGGRMGCVMAPPGAMPHALLVRRLSGALDHAALFDAVAPALPGFERAPAFVL